MDYRRYHRWKSLFGIIEWQPVRLLPEFCCCRSVGINKQRFQSLPIFAALFIFQVIAVVNSKINSLWEFKQPISQRLCYWLYSIFEDLNLLRHFYFLVGC